jgi:S-formylglutathione hydrolase FrmB
MRGWAVRVAVVVGVLLSALTATRANAATPVAFKDAGGLHVVSFARITDRQYDVSVSTPALGRAVDVRILLPSAYQRNRQRLPVLYLFHGTSGRASNWVDFGQAEEATAGLPLIVVMPDAGFDGDGGGWFTNWVDTATALGRSQWETFHVGQLIPWVDANLRTIASRNGRAIAGLSQGGFGSMTYAARHPDTFVSAASFSGAPDIDYNATVAAGATAIIEATAFGLDGVEPEAMFGSRVTNEINWQGHDPADLVTNLRPVDMWLYTATGQPGPLDSGSPNPGASGIEFATHESTLAFADRADSKGVTYHLDDYTYGTHTWPYWARDLQEYLPRMMDTFAHPPKAPASIDYESIDQRWTQWGWTIAVQRHDAQAFSALSGASRDGFTIAGTGTATVTTPRLYKRGAAFTVTASGQPPSTAVADSTGRLTIVVPLGPDVSVPAVMGQPVDPPFSVSVTIAAA